MLLHSAFEEIDKKQVVERIYCLGGMIAISSDTNKMLDLLFSQEDISMIADNRNDTVLTLIGGEQNPLGHIRVEEHHAWVVGRLDRAFVRLFT